MKTPIESQEHTCRNSVFRRLVWDIKLLSSVEICCIVDMVGGLNVVDLAVVSH